MELPDHLRIAYYVQNNLFLALKSTWNFLGYSNPYSELNFFVASNSL